MDGLSSAIWWLFRVGENTGINKKEKINMERKFLMNYCSEVIVVDFNIFQAFFSTVYCLRFKEKCTYFCSFLGIFYNRNLQSFSKGQKRYCILTIYNHVSCSPILSEFKLYTQVHSYHKVFKKFLLVTCHCH